MQNIPDINLGLIAVSRDCFPVELSKRRRDRLADACMEKKIPLIKINTIIENEKDVIKALKEINENNVNALVIYLIELVSFIREPH